MKEVEQFLKFERDNKLFEIKDKHGFIVWEAIRYCVGGQIIRNSPMGFSVNKEGHNSSVYFALKRFILFLFYSIRHIKCPLLFIIDSRDYNENTYFDAISDSLLRFAPSHETFVIETTFNWEKKNYKYGSVSPSIFTLLLRLNRCKYDFSHIKKLVENNFPNSNFDIREWEGLYKIFLTQYFFYNFFFKIIHIKKIIYVQNGIYKGLIAAAKKHNITTIELQHGQISRNHLAYSYHQSFSNINYFYNPDYLLTFSPFWLKDGVMPGTQIIPVGIGILPSIGSKTTSGSRKVLVVSSIIHEESLTNLVLEIIKKDETFSIYYKLHPDEYNRYEDFIDLFGTYKNVKVINDSIPISKLLQDVEIVLLVQSSVMAEALNAGKNVFVYRTKDYEVMDFLFEEEGVTLIDDASSFIKECNNVRNIIIKQGKYYMQFDDEKVKNLFL